jgi:hypothetical protein
MNEPIHSSKPGRLDDLDLSVREDLQALKETSARDVTALDQTIVNVRRRLRAPASWEERFMSTIETLKRRPWLATAGVVVVIATLLLVVPVSYEKTTAYDVALSVTGPNLGISQVRDMAQQLKTLLGADAVKVSASSEGGAPSFALTASVPAKSRVSAALLAQAYAHGLNERGLTASAATTPRREREWGSVYAYARDRVIRVSIDGKSAAELEAEVRQRLLEAGVTDAKVSIAREGTNGEKLKVEMKQVREATSQGGAAEEPIPQLELTKGGAPVLGQGFAVEIMKRKVHGGGLGLVINVNDGPRSAKVEIPNAESMSDAAIAGEIKAQLQRAGIEAEVAVAGGEIKIERKQ